MKIAMPIENGIISGHFGHAQQFAFVEVEGNEIKASSLHAPPPHEPGSLPKWLNEMGATHVICGGIGGMAAQLLETAGIKVVSGIPSMDPAKVVEDFISGLLKGTTGATCSGHEHGGEGHQCQQR
jgi:predicted Fe-Mo cluster-binding NifX family protein